MRGLTAGWGNERNHFAFVSPIDAKIFVHGDETVFWMQLAHPNETEIGQVRFAILVTLCQKSQVSELIVTDKIQPDEFFGDHLQDETDILPGGMRLRPRLVRKSVAVR